jgi:hypothetical protein
MRMLASSITATHFTATTGDSCQFATREPASADCRTHTLVNRPPSSRHELTALLSVLNADATE